MRVISALYLPKSDGEYGIRISIQDQTHLFQYKKAMYVCIVFNDSEQLLLITFSNDKFQLLDIFIYLVEKKRNQKKKNVFFQRIKG